MDWERAAAKYPHAVILGDPGFGKSWLLRYEARRLARQALTQLDAGATLDEIQLPILMRLADVARAARTRTVTEALAALASRSGQDNTLSASFHSWAAQRLQSGHCAALLDAWDEVAETPTQPNESLSRAELAAKLKEFSESRAYFGSRVLLTSRGAGYTGPPIANAQELELIAFEQNQIEQFAQVWFAGDPGAAARFLSLLKAHPAIRGLARIPLMLSLLSQMFTATPAEAFPQTRCEIYEQCLRGLLKDWKEEKQPGVEIEDADAMLEALSAFAFAIPIEQGAFKRSFLRKQMLQWLVELRHSDSFYGRQPETLIRRLLQDGILIKANDESDPDYLFLHRTFHEYLTACALAQQSDWLEQALQKTYDPAWFQALILLGGRLETAGQAERYIAALRNEQCPNTDIFFRPFLLAGFAAQEARETLSEQTKNKIFDETLRHWREPPHWLGHKWFLNALLSWNKRAFPALRALLRDEQVNFLVRGSVAKALAEMQDRQALPDILAFLRDERVRNWVHHPVVEALVKMQNREALPDILAFLRDERVDVQVRDSVAYALGKMQDTEALPDLRALLRDERVGDWVRGPVVEALGKMQDREALPDLRALLCDERVRDEVRGSVVEALAEMQDREALSYILAFLRDERVRDWVRRPVVEVLAKMRYREALPDLRALLRDERVDFRVRGFVAKALIEIKDREALPELRALLRDGRVDSDVRGEVAKALIEMKDREALPELRALLRDEQVDSDVRVEVAKALAELQDREALPELRALLRDEWVTDRLRVEVAKALAELQDREALPELRALLRDERVDDWVRGKFARALINLQDHEALPELLALLRDEWVAARVRVEVAKALAELQGREALPELRALLRDERVDFRLRVEVAKALIEMKDREALPDILALLRDEQVAPEVRGPVRDGLWKLAQGEKIPIRFE